jgi:ECF transporter S component (folate family)
MLFGNRKRGILNDTQTMVMLAMFIALSIVLGKQLSLTVGAIRISFENLPILMAGILFGPVAGALVGGCADVVGCLVVGYSINPIVTLGAVSIGTISGLLYRSSNVENSRLKLMLSIGVAHIVGSMLIKSIGLYVYYHYAVPVLLLRIPLYLVIGSLETLILCTLLESKAFRNQLSIK